MSATEIVAAPEGTNTPHRKYKFILPNSGWNNLRVTSYLSDPQHKTAK